MNSCIFAVEVEFAEVTYVIEENDGAGLYITLNARGNLSSAFTILLRTSGVAKGKWSVPHHITT